MDWLFESTLERNLLLIVLAAAVVVLLGGWVRSGKRLILPAALVAAVLIGVVLAASHFIETPREQIEAKLYRIATDVQNNDMRALLAHIHSRNSEIRGQAAAEMPKYRFEAVRINSIDKITTDVSKQPATARAEFHVNVKGNFGAGSEVFAEQGVTRAVTLDFEQENGEWKVTDYSHRAPLSSMDYGGGGP